MAGDDLRIDSLDVGELTKDGDPVETQAQTHALGGSKHTADTLANLNSKITDATLDDSGSPRTPTAHAASHQDGGADELNVGGLSGLLADPQTPAAHQASHVTGADQIPTFGAAARGLVPASGGGTTNFLRADGAFAAPPGGGGGDSISVNGVPVTDANLNDTTPAAPSGVNTKWQRSGTGPDSVSAYVDAASETIKGVVELATNGESAAGVVVQGNDSRLSDARTPTAHKTSHEQGGGDALETANLATVETDTAKRLRPDGAGGVEWAAGDAEVADPAQITDTWDDFLYGGYTDEISRNWRLGDNTSRFEENAITPDTQHPGVVVIRGSADTSGEVAYIIQRRPEVGLYWAHFKLFDSWVYLTRFGYPPGPNLAKTDAHWLVGCINGGWTVWQNNASQDGAYFECRSGEANWFSVTSDGGGVTGSNRTRKDTGIAWSPSTWIHFNITRVGNSYEFRINGSLVTTHTSPDFLPRDSPVVGGSYGGRYVMGAQMILNASGLLPLLCVDWMRTQSSSRTRTSGGGIPVNGTLASVPPIPLAFEKTVTMVKEAGFTAGLNVAIWRAPYNCTVTAVKARRTGGTGATVNARKNGTLNHLASNLSLTSAATWFDGGAVQNTAYAAGDSLEGMLVTPSGSPTQIVIQIEFTRNL